MSFFEEIPADQFCDIYEAMTERRTLELGGMQLWQGQHPERGFTTLVMDSVMGRAAVASDRVVFTD